MWNLNDVKSVNTCNKKQVSHKKTLMFRRMNKLVKKKNVLEKA